MVGQDLGPAAGDRPEPRLLEPGQHVSGRHVEGLGHGRDLDHGEGLHVHLRADALHRPDDVEVVGERQVGVHAADHVDLADRLVQVLAHAALDVVHRQDVGVLLLRRPVKGAALAARHADVRVIDVLVHDVIGVLAVPLLAHVVGERPHGQQVRVAVKTQAVGA